MAEPKHKSEGKGTRDTGPVGLSSEPENRSRGPGAAGGRHPVQAVSERDECRDNAVCLGEVV